MGTANTCLCPCLANPLMTSPVCGPIHGSGPTCDCLHRPKKNHTKIQQTKRKPLVDLMQRLYEAHHVEGTKKIGFEEQQKESQHLEHLLQQYMLVPEPNRNITYCNDEDGNGENTNGNYLQSELAMLMMKRIELQCQEDRNKKGWS